MYGSRLSLKAFGNVLQQQKDFYVCGKVLGKHSRQVYGESHVLLIVMDESSANFLVVGNPFVQLADTAEIGDILVLCNPVDKSSSFKPLGCQRYVYLAGVSGKLRIIKPDDAEYVLLDLKTCFSELVLTSPVSVMETDKRADNGHMYALFGKLELAGERTFNDRKGLTLYNASLRDEEGCEVGVTLFNDLSDQVLRFIEVGEVFVWLYGCQKKTYGSTISVIPNLVLWDAEKCSDFKVRVEKFSNASKLNMRTVLAVTPKLEKSTSIYEMSEANTDMVFLVAARITEFKNPNNAMYISCPTAKCSQKRLDVENDGYFKCKSCKRTFMDDGHAGSPGRSGRFVVTLKDAAECDVTIFGTALCRFYLKLGLIRVVEKLKVMEIPFDQFINPLIGISLVLKIKKTGIPRTNDYQYIVNDLVSGLCECFLSHK